MSNSKGVLVWELYGHVFDFSTKEKESRILKGLVRNIVREGISDIGEARAALLLEQDLLLHDSTDFSDFLTDYSDPTIHCQPQYTHELWPKGLLSRLLD